MTMGRLAIAWLLQTCRPSQETSRRMNLTAASSCTDSYKNHPRRYGHVLLLLAALGVLIMAGCSSEKGDKEPTVTVQVSPVEKTTIQHVVAAEAILFPLQQSAIVPKISAPVEKFLVKRGSSVHAGQLLAVLENRDPSAAAQDTKGALDQAQATFETTTGASLPEEIQKAEADTQQAQQALDAQQKVFESRQQLFQQGALPRKEL